MANNTPAVRFEGFSGEWSQVRLGDRAIIKGRLGWKSLKQDEYIDEGPSMIAGRHIKNGEIDWDLVDHIPQWRYDESPEIMLENGDVIFSKDGSLGNPALITNLKILATINSTMMLVRVDQNMNSSFLYQVMRSEKFKRLVYLKVSGSSIPHLFQADMNDFMFSTPLKEEQSKIGAFFKQLDDTIALQQQELDTLKQTKQGFLQKMFPKEGETVPEVRFEGFSGAWKLDKLKDLSTYIRGSFPQPYTNPAYYDEVNGKPFVQVADIGFDMKLKSDTKSHISTIAEPKSRFVEAGKVIVALQGSIEKSIGRTAITQYDAYFDRTILIFQDYKVPMNKQYFAQVIKSLFEREKEKAWGATISTITKEHLNDFIVSIPAIEEQQKIGSFFKQLDDTIALHQRELDALKETKQAFLQKMFV